MTVTQVKSFVTGTKAVRIASFHLNPYILFSDKVNLSCDEETFSRIRPARWQHEIQDIE
jgi:hypothetical protein